MKFYQTSCQNDVLYVILYYYTSVSYIDFALRRKLSLSLMFLCVSAVILNHSFPLLSPTQEALWASKNFSTGDCHFKTPTS